ncbi:hypothetical protein KGQ25_01480 [Patescibacteria group bacterium]|nr:hypothetical protein [Patescibacteria group bacterium]
MKSPLVHLILAAALCIASIIGYGVWYTVVAAQSAAVANLENQISTKIQIVSRVSSAQTALAGIAGDEAAVQSYFVPETGVVAFINDLEARGRVLKADVSVLSVSSGGTKTHPTFAFIIVVKGPFDAVMRTVGAIEYAPYALSLSSLSLGQDPTGDWSASLNLLVGSVPPAAATSTEQAAPSGNVSSSVLPPALTHPQPL